MSRASLYEILEVSPNARPAVIRAAYRCLAQEYHPDKNPGDTKAAANMALINRAYAVLIDPTQRARYDEKIALRTVERRGRGRAASTTDAKTAKNRTTVRRFAFRSL